MVPESFTNHLKRKLAAGTPVNGLWVTLESPTVTEIAVLLKLDFVVIDTEHGSLDFSEVLNHLRAIGNSTTTPIVRIPRIDQGIINTWFYIEDIDSDTSDLFSLKGCKQCALIDKTRAGCID